MANIDDDVRTATHRLEFNILSLADAFRNGTVSNLEAVPGALEDIATVVIGMHARIVELEAIIREALETLKVRAND